MGILAGLSSAWNWVMNSKPAQYALMIIGAILAFKTLQMKARMDGEKAERERQQRRAAEESAKIETTRREISEERTDDIQHAEQAARDHVVSAGPDELRARDPDLYSIVYGNAGNRSGEAEGR